MYATGRVHAVLITMRRIALALALAACGKSAAGKPDRCTATTADLTAWLATLEVENRSHELDFGYVLQVVDRAPMPIPTHVDNVEITPQHISVFDISEHDHAQGSLGDHPTPKAILDRLVATRAQKAGPDEYAPAPDDLLRLDVDRAVPWGAVAIVVDAATQAGYKHVLFAFTATSRLSRPPGVPETTDTERAAREASDKLDALNAQCKAFQRAARHVPAKDLSPADDALAHAQEMVAALDECKCVPNPDELRKEKWIDAHWHQAKPRVGVEVALDPAATPIVLPALTPWSEAHAKILAAKGPVKLVAN